MRLEGEKNRSIEECSRPGPRVALCRSDIGVAAVVCMCACMRMSSTPPVVGSYPADASAKSPYFCAFYSLNQYIPLPNTSVGPAKPYELRVRSVDTECRRSVRRLAGNPRHRLLIYISGDKAGHSTKGGFGGVMPYSTHPRISLFLGNRP